jgi:hypothetical protein
MYHEFLLDQNVPTQPPPMIPPRSLQRSHSHASDNSSSRSSSRKDPARNDSASSTGSVKEKRKTTIADQKSSLAWASAHVGYFAVCV